MHPVSQRPPVDQDPGAQKGSTRERTFLPSDRENPNSSRRDRRIAWNDAVADQLWEHLWVLGRRCYMAPRAPGSLAKAPSPNLPTEWMDRKPTLEASESGRANFCVIEVILSYMEWLELGFEGHTRAGYRWSEEGHQWKGCWLEP